MLPFPIVHPSLAMFSSLTFPSVFQSLPKKVRSFSVLRQRIHGMRRTWAIRLSPAYFSVSASIFFGDAGFGVDIPRALSGVLFVAHIPVI